MNTQYDLDDVFDVLPDLASMFDAAMQEQCCETHDGLSVLAMELLPVFVHEAGAERMIAIDPELAERLHAVAEMMAHLLDTDGLQVISVAYRAIANYLEEGAG